jgi:site-specific DNA-methyltransferase (adenine-specific)
MNGHNPDILTCLANLSADEVFTPPKLATAMLDLLPQDLFRRPDTTFLDPVCKSGVFLREIAKRLNDGLKDQMPDTQARIDHILTRQVFGLAITELTAQLARRSVYCSKRADAKFSIATAFARSDGNIRLPKAEHDWDDARRCTMCGANRGEYDRDAAKEAYAYPFLHGVDPAKEFKVKFDVIVGNPPYQLSDGGGSGTSAMPIYDRFVEQAKKLDPRYLSMVIPSRWFTGGKGLDQFRGSMLGDGRIRSLNDYVMASDVFPGVALKGGVCYFLWDRDNPGPCSTVTHFKGQASHATRRLLEPGLEVFVRYNEGLSILRKVIAVESGSESPLALPELKQFERLVSARRPFGFNSTFKGKAFRARGDLILHRKGGAGYVARRAVANGTELIDAWKLFVGFAAPGTGNKDTFPSRIISTPFIGEPGSVSSETYLCIGPFESRAQAESALSYLQCRLTRFLILLHKPSQNTTRRVYTFVPTQEWRRTWTDADLYRKYELSREEIEFVESMVRPMGSAEDDTESNTGDEESEE